MNVAAIWEATVADARALASTVDLCLADDSVPSGVGARYLPESRRIEVSVAGRSEVLVAALIRHELQHVVQVDACPDLYGVHALAEEVASKVNPPDAAGALYNTVPMELDANAAAYRFIVAEYGTVTVNTAAGEAPTDRVLQASSSALTAGELRGRMISWFAANVDLCRRHGRDGAPLSLDVDPDYLFSMTLNYCSTGAGVEWRQQVANLEGRLVG